MADIQSGGKEAQTAACELLKMTGIHKGQCNQGRLCTEKGLYKSPKVQYWEITGYILGRGEGVRL